MFTTSQEVCKPGRTPTILSSNRRTGTLLLAAMVAMLIGVDDVRADVQSLPDPYPYPTPAWSPYIAGGLIGMLVLVTLAFANKKIGASSAYADGAGMMGRWLAPKFTSSLRYFQNNQPMIGWTTMFVIGAIIGSFFSALSGGEWSGAYLQNIWIQRFGTDSYILRTIVAVLGGILMAFGARMAGGCTSGHGISGTLQLAVGSWIAVICFFIGGIVVAVPLYRF